MVESWAAVCTRRRPTEARPQSHLDPCHGDHDSPRTRNPLDTTQGRILLFVRQHPEDDRGNTSPYLFLGRVRYVSHESERPMRITWKLDVPMPLDFFTDIEIAAG